MCQKIFCDNLLTWQLSEEALLTSQADKRLVKKLRRKTGIGDFENLEYIPRILESNVHVQD